MSLEEARTAFEANALHTAVISDDGRPMCRIEFTMNFVSVAFFDEFLRVPLDYSFSRQKGGKLFLQRAITREFIGNEGKVARGSLFVFSENGTVLVEDVDYTVNTKSSFDTTTDVSGNWEEYPKFGEYERLMRRERLPA